MLTRKRNLIAARKSFGRLVAVAYSDGRRNIAGSVNVAKRSGRMGILSVLLGS